MRKCIDHLGRLLATSVLVVSCVGPRAGDGGPAAESARGALRVEVVSLPTGAPLPDLVVRLEARHDGSGLPTRGVQIDRERVRAHALIDGQGRAQFTPPPGIDLWVRLVGQLGAHADHVRPVAALQAGESRTVRFEVPALELGLLRGRVVHAEVGTPVEGARVAWLDDRLSRRDLDGLADPPRRPVLAATFTGMDGRFELSVPVATEGRMVVEAAGYRPMQAELSSPNRATLESSASAPLASSGPMAQTTDAELVMALEPCDQRAILVVDTLSRPVSGVDVIVQGHWSRLAPLRWPGDPHYAEHDDLAIARTGLDGVCWIPEPLVGGYFYIDAVSADGRWLAAHRSDMYGKTLWPDPRLPFVWRLAELQTIEGRARFEDGSAASGVMLGLCERMPREPVIAHHNSTFVAQTRTAPDGTFRFEAIRRPRPHLHWMIEPKPGPFDRLQLQRDALAPTRALVEYDGDGPPLPLDIQLRAARYVTGRVTDAAGRPATEGWLGLSAIDASVQDSTTCDPDGSFLLGPLAPGRYELRAQLDGSGEPRGPCELVIDTFGTTVTLDRDERYELVVE